jgi:hypothetical protein
MGNARPCFASGDAIMRRSLGLTLAAAIAIFTRCTPSRFTTITTYRRFSVHTMSSSALPYAREKQVAIAAVRRACALTSSVFNKLVKSETATKGDKSPVTGTLS